MPTKTKTTVVPYSSAYIGRYRKVPVPNTWNDLGSPKGGTVPSHDSELTGTTGIDARFRACSHEQVKRHYFDLSTINIAVKTDKWYVDMNCEKHLAMRLSTPSAVAQTTHLSDTLWDEFDVDALEQMLPSMSDNFSIINFLIELKDFRRLGRAVLDRKNRLKEAVGVSDEAWLTLSKTITKRPMRSLASGYLAYSFAWKPFIQDILAMWNKLHNVERELRAIWKRAGQPQTRHFTRNLDGYTEGLWSYAGKQSVMSSVSDHRGRDCGWHYQDRWQYTKLPVYHATCRYTYKVPGALDSAARLRGWLDAFGVRLDPSIIWNAIPFTFIIDWVIDVNRFLRSFSTDNLGLHFTVEDFCSSLKYQTVTEREVYQRRIDFGKVPLEIIESDRYLLSLHKQTSYTRRVGFPPLHAALVGSGLSAREVSLGGALILSNRRYTS